MPKLNAKTIARLPAPDPSGKPVLHFDDDLKGFGVLCSGTTNTKSYVVQRKMPGLKNPPRRTVGKVNEITLEEARDRAAEMLDQLRRGIDPNKTVIVPTLKSALESYLIGRPDLSDASIRVYREIERNLAPWIKWELRAITGDLVEKRHRELGNDSRSTANSTFRVLRAIWNFTADRCDLPPNPVNRLKRQWFKEPRRTRRVPTELLPAFHQAVKGLNNDIARDYILLMMFTGLRHSEASGLQWKEVDFADRMIRLPAERTKAKRAHNMPMSDAVHRILIARQELGRDVKGFVFPGDGKGGHLTANIQAWKIIKAQMIAAGVINETGEQYSAHDMRRTFASIAGETELSPFALKAMLNHSNDVTGGYVIISPPALRAAVQKVTDQMKALCELPELPVNVARMK